MYCTCFRNQQSRHLMRLDMMYMCKPRPYLESPQFAICHRAMHHVTADNTQATATWQHGHGAETFACIPCLVASSRPPTAHLHANRRLQPCPDREISPSLSSQSFIPARRGCLGFLRYTPPVRVHAWTETSATIPSSVIGIGDAEKHQRTTTLMYCFPKSIAILLCRCPCREF